MKRRILVTVSPEGAVTVEADGFHGSGCEAATKAIEAALGKTVHRTRKPEFRQRPVRDRSVQQLGEEE